ncbi:MAG: phosphoribosylaminoimidazolesuccinocarboxamide synthase [Saprospiraceae bacterium]|nr:phosphoribosylaminoimidazolesuccinocarboxamide synthase [Saprospiraceae bacterium]
MHSLPENYCIQRTDFQFKNLKSVYHGKVRDVYDFGEKLVIICTDRISAFDHILPRPIPYKGQVLNQIAQHFLEASSSICPVWLQSVPDPSVSVGLKCLPIPIEIVVRGYLAGHAWRTYKNGGRSLCGVRLKNGMKESQEFETPIVTPTTKASEGHDMDISRSEIISQNIVSKEILDKVYDYALELFEKGTSMASEKGLILVDTKYEFGIYNGEVILMDEIHTPDSSRYYISDGYFEKLENSKPQTQLSKEFVREWLMSYGFKGQEGELMPEMPDAFVWEISKRYIELYERITGKEFQRNDAVSIEERIKNNLTEYF